MYLSHLYQTSNIFSICQQFSDLLPSLRWQPGPITAWCLGEFVENGMQMNFGYLHNGFEYAKPTTL